jgi:hypothetical protein
LLGKARHIIARWNGRRETKDFQTDPLPGGELSPTVVETVEAHEGTLDLLVLWRGKAGWFNTRPSQAGANQSFIEAGGSDRIHRVSVHGRTLELRVDAKTNTAHIQNQMIPLQGVNVLLIDEVDQTSIRVAGTLWVDPKLLSFNPWSREDPVTAIIKQSPLLTDYVKH